MIRHFPKSDVCSQSGEYRRPQNTVYSVIILTEKNQQSVAESEKTKIAGLQVYGSFVLYENARAAVPENDLGELLT